MYMFFFFSCAFSCCVVSTCQMIGQKDSSDDAFTCREDYLHKDQAKQCVFVYFCFIYVTACLSSVPTIYFISLWHNIAYLC